MQYRLGADPEIFLLKSKKLQAVCGLIGADKWNPLQLDNLPKGFTIQEDNVALEFGIPPASSANEFVTYIKTVKNAFLAKYPGYSFSGISCTKFPAKQLEHPGAKHFGCEPDFNAWTNEENPKPKPPDPTMRSAGGHVHVETKHDPAAVVRAMDLFLGVPSVLMDSKGEARRAMYGAAGAHRVKPYGVEYRTLSNFWIMKDSYAEWVWYNTGSALSFLENMGDVKDTGWGDEIVSCINTGDVSMAKNLINVFNVETA